MLNPHQIFGIQVLTSIGVYSFLFIFFVFPYFKTKSREFALIVLTLPHLIRHLGMTLLTPGAVVGTHLNQDFAFSTALGDYITLLLGVLTIVALKNKWKPAVLICWMFNIIGLSDIILAGVKAMRYEVLPDLGPQWYVVAFWVPLLIVTHVLSGVVLVKKNSVQSEM